MHDRLDRPDRSGRPEQIGQPTDFGLPDFANTPASAQRPAGVYVSSDPKPEPKVTLLTPFYNTGEIFHETARSVFQQSFQEWEWLIINDGSSVPEAVALLADYRDRDPRVQVLDHTQNKGLSAARNTGFRAARTQYVVQLDSDDLLEPTAVEKWLWFLESYPEYAFVRGYSVGFGAQEYLWQKGFHDGPAFLEENLVPPTSMIRTAVHVAVKGYDESIHGGLEDWDFWLRCASQGKWGSTVPEYLDWYRRRETHQDRWANWDGGERQQAFLERLQQRYSALWQTGFPCIQTDQSLPNEPIPHALPCTNLLTKDRPHLLLILPWLNPLQADLANHASLAGLADNADSVNVNGEAPEPAIFACLEQLIQCGWAISVVATHRGEHAGLSRWTQLSPDIFVLPHFLRLVDYPRFLYYLVQSRQIDTIVASSQAFPALLFDYLETRLDGACLDWKRVSGENGVSALSADCQDSGQNPDQNMSQDLFHVGLDAIPCLHGWLVTRNGEHHAHGQNATDREVGSTAPAWLTELEYGQRWMEHQWSSWQQRATQLEQRSAEQHSWIAQLEDSKEWAEGQRANVEQRVQEQADQIAEQHSWIAKLENSKEWAEEQQANVEQRVQEQADQIAEQHSWIVELEQAKRWAETRRVQEHEQRIAEQQSWLTEHEQAKRWLDEQRMTWQEQAQEQQRQLAKQLDWIAELEQSKRWGEEQYKNWYERAQQQEQQNTQLRDWIAELEQARQWLDTQRVEWQAEAHTRQAELAHLEQSRWTQLGKKLGLLRPLTSRPRSRAAESDTSV